MANIPPPIERTTRFARAATQLAASQLKEEPLALQRLLLQWVTSPLQGLSALVAGLNYEAVDVKKKRGWAETKAWKTKQEPPFALLRQPLHDQPYVYDPPLYQFGDGHRICRHTDATGQTIDWADGTFHGLKGLELPEMLEMSAGEVPDLEHLVPVVRDLFTVSLNLPGVRSEGGKPVVFVPPLGTKADRQEAPEEEWIECWLISAADDGQRAIFSHYADADWLALARENSERYDGRDEARLRALLSATLWWTRPPDEKETWISGRVYRLHRPYYDERYQLEKQPGSERVYDAERLFISKESSIFHLPVFGGGRLIGILAFMQAKTKTGKIILQDAAFRRNLFDALNDQLIGVRLALSAGREASLGELAWFLRHNLATAHLVPVRQLLDEAAEALAEDAHEVRKRLQQVQGRLNEIELALDSLIPVARDRKAAGGGVDDFGQYLQDFAAEDGAAAARREAAIREGAAERLAFAFGGMGTLAGQTCPLPKEVLDMVLLVWITNAVRAYLTPVAPPHRVLIDRYSVERPARLGIRAITATQLELSDDGMGMDEGRRDWIQGLLEQVAAGLPLHFTPALARHTTGWSGTGLGLYTAARTLASWGARLHLVESRWVDQATVSGKDPRAGGHGSVFRLEWGRESGG